MRLEPTLQNKMKAVIVLLVSAAFAYGAPHPNLKFIMEEVKCIHKETLKTGLFDDCFVKDLKKNKRDNCEPEFFCQAQMELKKISKDIGNCSVDDLLRNLKQYNRGVNCTVPTGDETLLRSFIDDLLKCTQVVFSRPLKADRSQSS